MSDICDNKLGKVYSEKYFSKLRRANTNVSGHSKHNIVKPKRKRFKRRRYRRRVKIKTETDTKSMSSNLQNCMAEWQYQHQISYWKARALALETENEMLHQHIRSVYQGYTQPYQLPQLQPPLVQNKNKLASRNDRNKPRSCTETSDGEQRHQVHSQNAEKVDDEDSEDNLEFEVDDEWLKFMEHSEKHRRELRKQRELEQSTSELDEEDKSALVTEEKTQIHRANMTSLYGKGAETIIACETAMQFTFDRHVSQKKAPFWPNIPFRL